MMNVNMDSPEFLLHFLKLKKEDEKKYQTELENMEIVLMDVSKVLFGVLKKMQKEMGE